MQKANDQQRCMPPNGTEAFYGGLEGRLSTHNAPQGAHVFRAPTMTLFDRMKSHAKYNSSFTWCVCVSVHVCVRVCVSTHVCGRDHYYISTFPPPERLVSFSV